MLRLFNLSLWWLAAFLSFFDISALCEVRILSDEDTDEFHGLQLIMNRTNNISHYQLIVPGGTNVVLWEHTVTNPIVEEPNDLSRRWCRPVAGERNGLGTLALLETGSHTVAILQFDKNNKPLTVLEGEFDHGWLTREGRGYTITAQPPDKIIISQTGRPLYTTLVKNGKLIVPAGQDTAVSGGNGGNPDWREEKLPGLILYRDKQNKIEHYRLVDANATNVVFWERSTTNSVVAFAAKKNEQGTLALLATSDRTVTILQFDKNNKPLTILEDIRDRGWSSWDDQGYTITVEPPDKIIMNKEEGPPLFTSVVKDGKVIVPPGQDERVSTNSASPNIGTPKLTP